jgi:pimeloyl-ACP methyl ester carboxylesterase
MAKMRFIHRARALVVAGAVASFMSGCGESDTEDSSAGTPPTPQTYVLVHGAFAGAWAWERVVPLLEAQGNEVITMDLPAHGDDQTPVAEATLEQYTDVVVQKIDAASRPVILVGHSMGGQVISQAAEQRPEKIKTLVYLAAFLLEDGTSLLQASADDSESKLGAYVTPGTDGTASLAVEGIHGAFCTDCSDDDAAAIEAHLRPEPLSGFTTPIATTTPNWGSVSRDYIETKKDGAIGPAKQKAMYTALPCDKVLAIDSGHCPFLTKPTEVADALMSF